MLLNFLNSDSASRFLSLQTSNKHFLMAPVHTLSSPELVYIYVSSIYNIGCCSKFRWHGFSQVPLLLISIWELQQCFCDTIYFYLKIGTNSDLMLLSFHYCSVMSDSLQPMDCSLKVRLLCPWLSPRVGSKSCPLSRWCHSSISSSAVPFCPQSSPASGSFLISRLFA